MYRVCMEMLWLVFVFDYEKFFGEVCMVVWVVGEFWFFVEDCVVWGVDGWWLFLK